VALNGLLAVAVVVVEAVAVAVALTFSFTQPTQLGRIQAHPQPSAFLCVLSVVVEEVVQGVKAWPELTDSAAVEPLLALSLCFGL
jgi:hypothetical protein